MGAESTDDRPRSQRPEPPEPGPEAEAHRVEALRALHDRYAGMLWRYVVSLTRRPADADDVVQETLLRAWRRPSILAEDPAQVHGWLVTVAHNLVVDQARSAYRRHEEPVAEQPESTAEDRIDRLFDALLLRDALASLSADHREVIVRAYYGGCSTTELAAALGVPEGTVKSRLHYGLRALRLAIEERGVIR
ncbi:RNA polymerase subunit sigma [Brachybacterium vulturis]|uniref:RNA polymerase subunit sigma n=1 Tax=Brachybacterium vulturis TaxID=2017484 RepID=A0A291GKZ2_9MICO|nr:sigma-70 family RNA polymerase sigma factor [Brachybacterium vulturis]ATG50722.1 RNA polymerase subunit sigma [Brachybacterium vulturis]